MNCETGKECYSINEALEVKRQMNKRHKGAETYKCSLCGCYHITSRKNTRKGKMR